MIKAVIEELKESLNSNYVTINDVIFRDEYRIMLVVADRSSLHTKNMGYGWIGDKIKIWRFKRLLDKAGIIYEHYKNELALEYLGD